MLKLRVLNLEDLKELYLKTLGNIILDLDFSETKKIES